MDKQELVTIIIPTFNRAYILPRAIKSSLSQTYQNIELIIIDDGSTDNTEEIVKGFQDSRIQYIRHSENRGVSAARNTGIKSSKGDFIALLDSDDEYLPEKIEKSLKGYKSGSKDIGLVCTNFWWSGSTKKKIGFTKRIDPNWHFPSLSTWLLSKEVFEKIGLFDERFRVGQDREFMFRFYIYKKFSFYFVDEPLVIRYKVESSISSQTKDYIEPRKIFIEKQWAQLKKMKKFLAYQFYRLGKDVSLNQKKEARRYFLKAFLTYPVRVEYLWKFLRSYINKLNENK